MGKRNTETPSETLFGVSLFRFSFRRSIERNTETPETHTYRCVSVFRFGQTQAGRFGGIGRERETW